MDYLLRSEHIFRDQADLFGEAHVLVPTAQTPFSQFMQHIGARNQKIHVPFLSNSRTWSGAFRPQLGLAQDCENSLYRCRSP